MKLPKPKKEEWRNYSAYSDFFAEPKLDGMRIKLTKQNGKVDLYHDTNNKNLQFPEIMRGAEALPDCVLDGELVIEQEHNITDFELLLQRSTTDPMRIRILSERMPAKFYAFDILKYLDEDTTPMILTDRKAILQKIPTNMEIGVIDSFEPQALFESQLKDRLEGIVLKDKDTTYYGSYWLKFKNFKEGDFKVVGYTSEKRLISALELEDNEGHYVGRVNYINYPQTEEMASKLKGMTAVVVYLSLKDKLRFPVLKELRRSN